MTMEAAEISAQRVIAELYQFYSIKPSQQMVLLHPGFQALVRASARIGCWDEIAAEMVGRKE
jgi:hypothetical protein